MNNRQNSKFTTGHRMLDFLLNNAAVVTSLVGFAALQTLLTNLLAQIDVLRQKQQTKKTGLTIKKNKMKMQMITDALQVSSVMVAYASSIDDDILAKTAHYVKSDLFKESDERCKTDCLVLYSIAEKYLEHLASYNYTAQSLATFKTDITSFDTIANSPKESKKDGVQQTKQMIQLESQVQKCFSKMDIIVETVRYSNPDFYSAYHTTRSIEYRKHSLMVKGKINDADGLPMNGVHLSFVLDGKEILAKLTGISGGFAIKSIPEGTYNVTISKIGFKSQTITLHVTHSDLAKLTAVMVKM
jgi:hypothetical protein